MGWVWSLIVGAVIGAIAGSITKTKNGCFFNIMAGLLGSMIGESIFGDWGWEVGGMAVFPSILGAVIFVGIVSLIFNRVN